MKHPLLLASAIICAAPLHAASVIYSSGHGDIGIGFSDGTLELHLHLEDEEEIDPADAIILVPASTAVTLSSNAAFLGAGAGSTIWVLPASGLSADALGAPHLGWSTEELAGAQWIGNLTITLESAVSPSGTGNFAVWQSDAFGGLATLAMSTATNDGVGVVIPAGQHDHYQIGFTEPGLWEIELRVSGTNSTAGPISGTATYFFQVIPEPSTAMLSAMAALGLACRRRRHHSCCILFAFVSMLPFIAPRGSAPGIAHF